MTYRSKNLPYLYVPVVILAVLLVIAVPVLASDVVECGTPTPTPTPTPCPTPITPPPSFTCPAGAQNLVTATGDLVGCVAVTNDKVSLSVTFTSNPSLQMRTANWTWGFQPGDIPVDSTGTPALDKFRYSYVFKDGETSHAFAPVDISGVTSTDVGQIFVSAHATVEKKNVQTCSWVYSGDGGDTFKATSNPKLGADVSSTPKTRSGTAVPAWAPGADSALYLRGTSSSSLFKFTKANWIWESYRVVDPWKGDIVDFTKTFALAGTPLSGTLWITADDGYDVSLNGASVGNHGLLSGWRTSDLKFGYVPGHGIWKSVEKFDITPKLVSGSNTLFVQTANRYMGCDNPVFANTGTVGSDETLEVTPGMIVTGTIVGCGNYCAEPKGTVDSNVGALKYEAYVCSAAPSTTDAWAVTTSATGQIKYFPYLIMKVQIGFSPDPASAQLPGGRDQTITAATFDRSGNPMPAVLLTFMTDFGTFADGSRLTTSRTDATGVTKVTVSSSVAGSAIFTAWTDTDKDGIVDPGEWRLDYRDYLGGCTRRHEHGPFAWRSEGPAAWPDRPVL